MSRNERLLIGGDWSANVGRGSARNGVCGVRQNERHRMIGRMRSELMNELSDHKPKKVVICVEKKRWRAVKW